MRFYVHAVVTRVVSVGGARKSESSDVAQTLEELIGHFTDVITSSIGQCGMLPYYLEPKTANPLGKRHFGCSLSKLVAFRGIINRLLIEGVIEPSNSEYAAPSFLVGIKILQATVWW